MLNYKAMFDSADEAREWLQAQGYSIPAQLTFTLPQLGAGSLEKIAEWALLAHIEDAQGHLLHIYWFRPKPEREAWQHPQYVVHQFARKYPQIFPLFLVKRKEGCWIVCSHPDPSRNSWANLPRALLTPDNITLLSALRHDPSIPVEKHWQRILRAITGEEAMYPRIEQAFENFLAELNEILAEAQETIKRKIDEGRFGEIAALSQQAQLVQQLIEEVGRLKQRWSSSGSASEPATTPRRRRRRASRGEITPQSAYARPLLQALVDLGGRATMEAVLEKVHALMKHRLKPKDYEKLPSGEDIRWRNAVMWLRYKLKQQGYIKPNSPKGIWEITDAGREYLKQLQAEEASD